MESIVRPRLPEVEAPRSKRRPSPTAPVAAPEPRGYDFGSAEANAAAKKLESMGAIVHPPGNNKVGVDVCARAPSARACPSCQHAVRSIQRIVITQTSEQDDRRIDCDELHMITRAHSTFTPRIMRCQLRKTQCMHLARLKKRRLAGGH